MRTRDADTEARSDKLDSAVLRAVNGGLSRAVDQAGGTFTGVTLKSTGYDWLAVFKARFEEKAMITFITSESLAGCLRKAEREIASNKAKWRADKWAGQS